MTNGLESAKSRGLTCAACGTGFTCDPSGACWCMEESVRLPLPVAGRERQFQDCLCRACLIKLAGSQAASAT
jgi:hypothetical protein